MIEQVGHFTRQIHIVPAYDKKKEGYGIHGMELRFILIGPKGATQFVMYTGMQLPHVRESLAAKNDYRTLELTTRPMGADIGYHALEPAYEGQCKTSHCEYLNGPCYYDGSGLQADEFLPIFLEKGEPAVWEMLTDRYDRQFNGV